MLDKIWLEPSVWEWSELALLALASLALAWVLTAVVVPRAAARLRRSRGDVDPALARLCGGPLRLVDYPPVGAAPLA
jgi:hypothetical protein